MRSIRTSFLLLFLIKVLLTFDFCAALYEDQIKKFDWTLENIGEIITAQFYTSDYNTRIFVATKENVLAALCPRTGKLLWRRILEKGPRGSVRFFHIENEVSSSAVARTTHPSGVITVTGHAPAIVRGWSPATGNVEWEWSVMPVQQERAEDALWFFHSTYLYHVIPVWGSHLEVTKYLATTGQSRGTTARITAPWIQDAKCTLAASHFVCLDKNQLIWLDLTEDTPQIQRKTLDFLPKAKPEALKSHNNAILLDDTIISLVDERISCQKESDANAFYSILQEQPAIILTTKHEKILQISTINANTCDKLKDSQKSIQIPDGYGKFKLEAVDCKVKRGTNKFGCNYLFSTEDGAIILTNGEDIRWTREESLSKIVAVEFIDLPLSDAEGAIETELNSKPGDILGALVRRFSSQILQLKHIFFTVVGLGIPQSATQKAGLVRDAFGLHKMIVAATNTGKLFGIDNLNGKIHWMKYLPSVDGFANNENVKLIVQRTSKHFPNQPLCSLVGREKSTGFGLLYRFNPITGQQSEGGLTKLDYKVKQLALLRDRETDFLKPLLLLDANNAVHVLPEDAKSSADNMYMFTANKQSGTLQGFYIDAKSEKVVAKPIWKVNLSNQGSPQKIIKIAGKNPNEHVHSQGRVLSDRSVLYKYINPNLVAVVTQSLDPIHKYILNVYLIDVVSGSIVYSMSHRKAREPLHIVHSENWLVYSYYNDKVRRTELTTVELYEGKVQTNSTIWSSLDALPVPLIEKQSYILPSTVETMRETITERGITNKHVLIGISSGAVVEMPWALLDPRRPVSNVNQAREEGSIPYIPELPLPTENIINYNQSISRIENIHTAPSGLESTCLVIAHGLDIFVTRVAPSKTFDLLKEDFDYFLITVVLIALITGSFVAKHLSARKALKQAWK